MFANIPQTRLVLYVLLLGLVPFTLAVVYIMSQVNTVTPLKIPYS